MTPRQVKYGYTPLLWDGDCWNEAYGYLGSYYPSYKQARYEIDFIMSGFPHKYHEWCIERRTIEPDNTAGDDNTRIAQSKGAPP